MALFHYHQILHCLTPYLFLPFLLIFCPFLKLLNKFDAQFISLMMSVFFRTGRSDGRLVWAVTTAIVCICLFETVYLPHWHHLHLTTLHHLHGICVLVIPPIID